MKQQTNFHRLPGYDRATSRGEFAAFLSLALVGLPILIWAVQESISFSESKDAIVASLESRPANANASVYATTQPGTKVPEVAKETAKPAKANRGPNT